MSYLCPECHADGRYLPGISADAYVDYYRCDKCGHVWTMPKQKAEQPREKDDRKEQPLRALIVASVRRSDRVHRPRPLDREWRRLTRQAQHLSDRTFRAPSVNRLAVRRLQMDLCAHRADIRSYWARVQRKRATCGYFFVSFN